MATVYIEQTDKTISGIDKLHFSIQEHDRVDFIKYGDMYRFPNTTEITVTPNVSSETFYADDSPVITYAATGDVAVSITQAHLPQLVLATLLGSPVDGAVRHLTSTAKAPYVGIAFRVTMSDDTYQFVKLYKGKFQEPEMTATTKEGSISFQPRTINATFIATSFEKEVGGKTHKLIMSAVDESAEGYKQEGDTWFDSIHEATAPAFVPSASYGKGAVVLHEGKFYRAKATFTATETFVESDWEEIV